MQTWIPWAFIIVGIILFIFGLFAMFMYHFQNTSSTSVAGWIWFLMIAGVIIAIVGLVIYFMVEKNRKDIKDLFMKQNPDKVIEKVE